jgi:hypothetical protein
MRERSPVITAAFTDAAGLPIEGTGEGTGQIGASAFTGVNSEAKSDAATGALGVTRNLRIKEAV